MRRFASGASTRASRKAGRRKPKVYRFSETYSSEPLQEAVQIYHYFDRLPEKLRLFLKTANYQWEARDLYLAVITGTPVAVLIDEITKFEKEEAENVYRSLRP